MKRDKVRYAVVGLGHVARVAVLPAFGHAENSELTALVSGDPTKLRALGDRYGAPIRVGYEDYDALLASGEIDAVYIALPNHLHREYTVRAARAGVHVLCEKPMALTEDDCRAMTRAAEDAGVKLMIAYRLHFEEGNMRVVEQVRSGTIGQLRLFESCFTMNVRDAANIRLSGTKGGGTLYDIGIYCINAARYLFRAEPTEVFAFTERSSDPRFREVDEMSSVMLRFPRERLASFVTSFGAGSVSSYRLVGTEGSIRMEPAFDYASALAFEIDIDGQTEREEFPKRDQFAPELIRFSDCIRKNLEPEPNGNEGLADVRIVEAAYRSAREARPIRLEPFPTQRRPAKGQALFRPPVTEKPDEVNAEGPRAD